MISLTKVVRSNEIINSPNRGVEGSHSPNEQDPGYNEHGFRGKIFSKNHCWFSLRQRPVEFTPDLPRKIRPNLTVCTLSPTKLHQNWKNLQPFSSSFLYLLHKKVFIRFFSFLIFLFLDAQKRLIFMVLLKKTLGKQISKTNWWCDFPCMP